MDADVLYDEGLVERLVTSRHQNCLLLDRASSRAMSLSRYVSALARSSNFANG